MNPYAIAQELQTVAACAADAEEWIRKGDLNEAVKAVEEAQGLLGDIEDVLSEAILDAEMGEDAETGAVLSPSAGKNDDAP